MKLKFKLLTILTTLSLLTSCSTTQPTSSTPVSDTSNTTQNSSSDSVNSGEVIQENYSIVSITVDPVANKYQSIEYVGESIYKAQDESGDWGLIDIFGNPITDFIYKDFDVFSEGYIIYHTQTDEYDIENGTYFGTTNELEITGHAFLESINDELLIDGYTLNNQFSNTGYMNTKGEIMLESFYDHEMASSTLRPFKNGLAYVGYDYSFSEIPKETSNSSTSDWVGNAAGGSGIGRKAMFINTDFSVEFNVNPQSFFSHHGSQRAFSEDGLCFEIIEDEDYNTFVRYIDKTGAVVIENDFINASSFNDGYAIVTTKDEELSVIDTSGNIVLNTPYSMFLSPGYVDGTIIVQDKSSKKWGAIDINGDVVVDFIYDNIYQFNNGYARAIIDNKQGFINDKGEELTEFIYDITHNNTIYDLNNNLAPVSIENKWGFINEKGDTVIPLIYDKIIDVYNDFAIVGVGDNISTIEFNGLYGLISTNGETLIDVQYDSMIYIDNDLFIVSKDGKFGIIDITGDELAEIKYDEIKYNNDVSDGATAKIDNDYFLLEF